MRRNRSERVGSIDTPTQAEQGDWQRNQYRYIAQVGRYYEWMLAPGSSSEYGWVQSSPDAIPDEILNQRDTLDFDEAAVDDSPTKLFKLNDIPAEVPPAFVEECIDGGSLSEQLAAAQALWGAVNEEVSRLARAKEAEDAEVERQRLIDIAEAQARVERERQAAAEEAERSEREKVAAALKAFRNQGQIPFTEADVRNLKAMSQQARGHFESDELVQSSVASRISTSEKVTAWPLLDNTHEGDNVGVPYEAPVEPLSSINEKQPLDASVVPSVTPAELLFRASLIDRANNFRRTYPKVTIVLGAVAAALAVGAWGIAATSSSSAETAAYAELKLPKGGLEFPDSCIDLEKPEAALVKESVSAWMQLDLRNEAGIAYSFNGANDSSRVGTGLIFNDADAYLSACEGDVPALSVNDKNANEIIADRSLIVTKFVIDANEVEATPVDAEVASKTKFADPADTEWLVGLLQGDKFTATIDNGEAAIADAIMSDTAMRKDFERKLDAQVTSRIKDSIKDLAKKSKVDEGAITVKMTGTYSAAETLNGTTEVPGVVVVAENIVTVPGKTIDVEKIKAEAAK